MEEKDIFTNDSETLQRLIELLRFETEASWSIMLQTEKNFGKDSPEATSARWEWCALSRMLGAAINPVQLNKLLDIWRTIND